MTATIGSELSDHSFRNSSYVPGKKPSDIDLEGELPLPLSMDLMKKEDLP